MIRILILCLCAAFLGGCATKTGPTAPAKPRKAPGVVGQGQRMTVRTTAYTHTEPGGIKNAIGTRLRFGGKEYSAASDWSWLPLGTRFRMIDNGRIYVIEDYGSALVNRKTVDLYMPTRRMMNAWGVRHKEIEIIEWGSKAMSLKMLTPRTRNRHVAVMVAQLRRDGVRPPG
jgi:3D (Asp-Asp-Asp) domain-containing protein